MKKRLPKKVVISVSDLLELMDMAKRGWGDLRSLAEPNIGNATYQLNRIILKLKELIPEEAEIKITALLFKKWGKAEGDQIDHGYSLCIDKKFHFTRQVKAGKINYNINPCDGIECDLMVELSEEERQKFDQLVNGC